MSTQNDDPKRRGRLSRDELLADTTRALRACFPDRAEDLILELERRMKPEGEPEPFVRRATAKLSPDATPESVAKSLIELVDSIEREDDEGARFRWSAAVEKLRDPTAIFLEVRVTPASLSVPEKK
jgi:hypothetical protein